MLETYAVKVLCPHEKTGQPIKTLGIMLVDAFSADNALIKAIKLCAKHYYEDLQYNKEEEIPHWLLRYYREDFLYGTAFQDLSFKVLS